MSDVSVSIPVKLQETVDNENEFRAGQEDSSKPTDGEAAARFLLLIIGEMHTSADTPTRTRVRAHTHTHATHTHTYKHTHTHTHGTQLQCVHV